jgi:hypothetical protein
MAQVVIEYDARNSSAKKIMNFLLSFDCFKLKDSESVYDEEFLNVVEKSFKGKRTVIKVDDLWK